MFKLLCGFCLMNGPKSEPSWSSAALPFLGVIYIGYPHPLQTRYLYLPQPGNQTSWQYMLKSLDQSEESNPFSRWDTWEQERLHDFLMISKPANYGTGTRTLVSWFPIRCSFLSATLTHAPKILIKHLSADGPIRYSDSKHLVMDMLLRRVSRVWKRVWHSASERPGFDLRDLGQMANIVVKWKYLHYKVVVKRKQDHIHESSVII